MALHALVYCDCFEKNNLRCDPPGRVKVTVRPNGDLSCETADERVWSAFSAWKRTKACFHRGMVLAQHRLGRIAAIDLLRSELQKEHQLFPILLGSVLYSGTHTCDWIPFQHIPDLSREVIRLNPDKAQGPASDTLRVFKIQMAELIIAAQHTEKPICF